MSYVRINFSLFPFTTLHQQSLDMVVLLYFTYCSRKGGLRSSFPQWSLRDMFAGDSPSTLFLLASTHCRSYSTILPSPPSSSGNISIKLQLWAIRGEGEGRGKRPAEFLLRFCSSAQTFWPVPKSLVVGWICSGRYVRLLIELCPPKYVSTVLQYSTVRNMPSLHLKIERK